MSTSAVIKVEGINFAKVYKHWDGYPSATLLWLTDFNARFTNARGDDAEYKFAQLLRNSVKDGTKYNLDDSEVTGWGVTSYKENVGEFEYILHTDGTVTYKETL